MDRRTLVTRAAVLGGAMFVPDFALARTQSVVSWPHSLDTLMQDDRNSTSGASHTHWDLPHDNHRIDYCWQWLAGAATGTLGWLVFREKDAQNFYQVEHRVTGIALVKRVAGVFSTMQFHAKPILVGGDFMQRLEMNGSDLSVYDLNADGSLGARILHVTDSTYLSGVNFSYYTSKVSGCWEFAKGITL